MRIIVIIIIVGLFLISATTVQASWLKNLPGPQIMPDSPFYKIKIWYEKVITFLSFGDTKKAERYAELAERRLYEAEKMAEKGKEKLTQKLLNEYEKYLDKALEKADELKQQAVEGAKQKARDKANQTLQKVSESTLKNQDILLRVYQLVPDQAKEAIERVMELTKAGYERAAEAVSGIKKEELQQKAEDIKIRAQKLIKNWRSIFEE